MKHLFYLCLTMILLVFMANESFAKEANYDPVEVEQSIYCDCYAVAPIVIEVKKEKEYKHLEAVPIRQNETFGIFFKEGVCLSRDNTETEKESILYNNYILEAITNSLHYRK